MVNEELVVAARELRGLIQSEAERTEAESTMSPAVVAAIEAAGLFRLLVPTAFGGHEANVDTLVAVAEELAYADGSVGWAFVQNVTVGGYLAYVDPEFAAALSDRRAGGGCSHPLGVARIEPGGYRVSGSYPFGSGSAHAEYLGGAALVMDGADVAPPGADGTLPVIGFLIPSEQVTITGNWDVMGLRGTGSYDFEVPEPTQRSTRSRPEGPEIVEQRLRESKAVASFVVESCRDVVTSCWRASGSAGIRNPSALQRCFRDISVGAGHQAFDERNYGEFAKSLLDLEPSPF